MVTTILCRRYLNGIHARFFLVRKHIDGNSVVMTLEFLDVIQSEEIRDRQRRVRLHTPCIW